MKLKQAILAVGVLVGLGACLVAGRPALAVTCPDGTVNEGKPRPTYAECNIDSDATTDDLLDTIRGIINVVLGLLGVVAVVVIIYGGFTFTASQGDAGRVMKGRNTILWGVVGLVVALASFAIVNFVLDSVTKKTNDNPSTTGEPLEVPASTTNGDTSRPPSQINTR